MQPRPPAEGDGSVERPSPLVARLREPTDEEVAAREHHHHHHQQTVDLQEPLGVNARLPPVSTASHGERDSHSTGSTGSTERSEQAPSRTQSDIKTTPMSKDTGEILPASKQKLAMDALQRGDYELLAMITGNSTDSPGIDGPRAPVTPTNPHGSVPYSNGQVARYEALAVDQHSITSSTGRPESAPTHSRNLQGSPPATSRRPVSGMISHQAVEDHGWGMTPQRGRYVEPEEIEAIVQRTNEKLEAETRKMKVEFEARIAQLEAKPAWADPAAGEK